MRSQLHLWVEFWLGFLTNSTAICFYDKIAGKEAIYNHSFWRSKVIENIKIVSRRFPILCLPTNFWLLPTPLNFDGDSPITALGIIAISIKIISNNLMLNVECQMLIVQSSLVVGTFWSLQNCSLKPDCSLLWSHGKLFNITKLFTI